MNIKKIILIGAFIFGMVWLFNFIRTHEFIDLLSIIVVVGGLITVLLVYVVAKKEAGTNG